MSYEKLPEEKRVFIQAAWSLQAPLMETEGPWTRRWRVLEMALKADSSGFSLATLLLTSERHGVTSLNLSSFVRWRLHFVPYRIVVRITVFVPCTAHSEPCYNLPHLLLVKPTFANPEKTFTLPTLSHPGTALTVIRFFRILVPARGSARESSCCSRSGVDAEDLSLSPHVCAQTGQRGLFSGSWFAFWISSLNQASLAGPLPSAYPSPALSGSLSTLRSLSLLFHCWPAVGVKLDRSFSHS